MASLQNLEAAFGKATDQLYQGLLDLNTPAATITQRVSQVLSMRDGLLAMYGVPQKAAPPQKGAGKGKGAAQWQPGQPQWQPGQPTLQQQQQQQQLGGKGQAQGAVGADQAAVDWKGKLIQLVCKRIKRAMTKGEMVFEVTGSDQDGGYVACVTCELLQAQYTGELSPSKKQSEHSACKAVIAAEFPGELGLAAPAEAWGGGAGGGAGAVGSKRPAAALGEERDNKSNLIHSMQMLLQRPVQKGDIEYETKLVEENVHTGGYVSVVTLPGYDQEAGWEGAKGESKKQAEQHAAGEALAALAHVIPDAEEIHKEKKAKVMKEKREQMAAKKAEAGETTEG